MSITLEDPHSLLIRPFPWYYTDHAPSLCKNPGLIIQDKFVAPCEPSFYNNFKILENAQARCEDLFSVSTEDSRIEHSFQLFVATLHQKNDPQYKVNITPNFISYFY
ncbi:hypothetical protein KSP39_PZI024473 [Platanthera zijinensis]|uniref:Uncharacterized protein n=1 Tax=Platanthera zijinensis TaxID=2320716 RepID=A0AAP0ASP3_9ASPA